MTNPFLHLASVTRGLYRCVADKFGVDQSYVSRIARGERHSSEIEAYLHRESQRIMASMLKRTAKVKKK
jgi:hypothetical protein